MSTDSRPGGALEARRDGLVPAKPLIAGLEDKWSRRWEASSVVQV